MRITLYAVGNKMPAWVSQGFNEYCRRFPRDMSFHLVEIPPGKRGKNADIAVSYTQSPSPRDATLSRMPSSA